MRKQVLILAVVGVASVSVAKAAGAQTYAWERNSSNLVYLQGKVGIGTRFPVKKLHVEGDMWIGRSGGSDLAINTPPGSVRLNSHGDDIIFPEGNVGIGTLDPTKKLTVDGTVRAKEIIVDSGWADHVFAENYKLQSIEDLALFINQNRRLPGMVTAEQVAENGVGVSEALTKLLTKVEELSLYLIDMNDRLQVLEHKAIGGDESDDSYLSSLEFLELEGRKIYFADSEIKLDQGLAKAILGGFPSQAVVISEVNQIDSWSLVGAKVGERLITIIATHSNTGWAWDQVGSPTADQLLCAAPELLLTKEAKASVLLDSDSCPVQSFSEKYAVDFGVLGQVFPKAAKENLIKSLSRLGKPTSDNFQFQVQHPLIFKHTNKLLAFELVNIQHLDQKIQVVAFKTNRKWHSILFRSQSLNWVMKLLAHDFQNFLSTVND